MTDLQEIKQRAIWALKKWDAYGGNDNLAGVANQGNALAEAMRALLTAMEKTNG